jgi:hypothetical protein
MLDGVELFFGGRILLEIFVSEPPMEGGGFGIVKSFDGLVVVSLVMKLENDGEVDFLRRTDAAVIGGEVDCPGHIVFREGQGGAAGVEQSESQGKYRQSGTMDREFHNFSLHF